MERRVIAGAVAGAVAALVAGAAILTTATQAPVLPTSPDPRITPGKIDPALTAQVICGKGWSTTTVRAVNTAEKRAVARAYGLDYDAIRSEVEFDHLISLELGGANDPANLWPQTYTGPLNAHMKDRLENRLHAEVCSGQISLQAAQSEISTDWVAAFRKRFGN